VIITNQVQSTPDTFFGDPTKAAGGNIIGHASTYRIYLRKAGAERKAIMIDSPMHPYGDTNFMVVEAGITDPTEKKPAKFVKQSYSKNADKERDEEEE
jgi:DNA repair protein RadA